MGMTNLDLANETALNNVALNAALIEAILFLEAEAIDEAALSRISSLSPEAVKEALEKLENRYAEPDSGLELQVTSGRYMIFPKRILWETLKPRYGKKNENRLSRAAMETLSIVAYSQPITRAEVEAIRGTQADNMIRLLVEKNLIKEMGKKDVPGRPVQYGTTREFLKVFGLGSIADLPKLDESEAERFELEGEL
jgi:segregation and condensation protein B